MKVEKIHPRCFLVLGIALPILFGIWLPESEVHSRSANEVQPGCSWPLPFLPSSEKGIDAFQKALYDFVSSGCYKTSAGWKSDIAIRDTGPFINGKPYGTHNAVKVYYSPEIVKWLNTGRNENDIQDGATIIKEMYPMPAAQQTVAFPPPGGWAIMVRDKKGSWDGWFWSDGSKAIDYSSYPNAGFGLYCINCHASAKTNLTFAASRNISGSPITFNPTMQPNQISTATTAARRPSTIRAVGAQPQLSAAEDLAVHTKRDLFVSPQEKSAGTQQLKQAVGRTASLAGIPKQLVGQWYDNAPQPRDLRMFVTANQCIGCHDATQNNAGQPNMMYPQLYGQGANQTELDLNVSPYSEWRSSMMGLSGRDPVFYSQLETEINLHPELKSEIINTCMSCHGVMGKRQIDLDNKGPFRLEYLDLKYPEPFSLYGGLARDGVSCAVCHHISAEDLGKPSSYTGKFKLGKEDEIFGPYEDVVTTPMKNGLGLTPRRTKENQIRTSALCGSCHTVILPVLKVGEKAPSDVFEKPSKTEHEQNTYLEWRNSKYQDEQAPIDQAAKQTCQDCHMPSKYPAKTGNEITFKIASTEEDTFPASDFRAPDEEIHLKVRGNDPQNPYGRHTLVGLNLFVMEMFNQFPDKLGVSTYDPMATWGNPVPGPILANKSALDMARNETAQIEISSLKRTPSRLTAEVKVTNLAGHKFPSGVSFRRAFIELKVSVGGKAYWVSGATNEKGVIGAWKGGRFTPLVTEFFDKRTNPGQIYQHHYDGNTPITDEGQVQIYEELVKDSNGNFTTSFLSLDNVVKDNRLMPQGWRPDGPDAKFTLPQGVDRTFNPEYFNGSGTDVVVYQVPLNSRITQPITVTATIYYQAIPPYFLQQRFAGAPTGVFTQSLKYYTEHLDTNKIYDDWKLLLGEAPIKDWKLMITTTTKALR